MRHDGFITICNLSCKFQLAKTVFQNHVSKCEKRQQVTGEIR